MTRHSSHLLEWIKQRRHEAIGFVAKCYVIACLSYLSSLPYFLEDSRILDAIISVKVAIIGFLMQARIQVDATEAGGFTPMQLRLGSQSKNLP